MYIVTQNDGTENKASLEPLALFHVELIRINAQDIQWSSRFYAI